MGEVLVAGFAAGEERAVFERIEPVGEDAAIEGPGITRFAETGDEFEVRERTRAAHRETRYEQTGSRDNPAVRRLNGPTWR